MLARWPEPPSPSFRLRCLSCSSHQTVCPRCVLLTRALRILVVA